MSNRIDSMRSVYSDVTFTLSSGAYLICFVTAMNYIATAGTFIVIYDGQAITDPILLKINSPQQNSRTLNIIPPVQVNNGLYVVLPANYYVTIGYVPLS